jgi:predicted acetyltransferase
MGFKLSTCGTMCSRPVPDASASLDTVTNDIHTQPIDTESAAELATQGLRFEVVEGTDGEIFEPWFQAMARGFHGARADEEKIQASRGAFAERRITGIWDDGVADPQSPVATGSSWIADLTVPGRASIPAWAISTITVAPTHRRRGLARHLLESELRTAAALDVPVAMLTVSEATIYGRFGFAPSAMATNWKIDTKRAKWTGPVPTGRLHLVPLETVRDGGGFDIVERARLLTPGLMHFDGHLWTRLFGQKPHNDPNELRVIRYDDEAGMPQGFAVYKAVEEGHSAKIQVKFLVAATDDAYAALWRYLLELDLIDVVEAELRPTDEPFQWQIADARAARKDHEGDHLWTRILDVKRALESRTYSAAGEFVLHITDPQGYAAGSWLLEVSTAGRGTVRALADAAPYDDNHSLALSINDLSAVWLGGTSVTTLVRAGRIREISPGSAVAADAAFRSATTPWLNIWF